MNLVWRAKKTNKTNNNARLGSFEQHTCHSHIPASNNIKPAECVSVHAIGVLVLCTNSTPQVCVCVCVCALAVCCMTLLVYMSCDLGQCGSDMQLVGIHYKRRHALTCMNTLQERTHLCITTCTVSGLPSSAVCVLIPTACQISKWMLQLFIGPASLFIGDSVSSKELWISLFCSTTSKLLHLQR